MAQYIVSRIYCVYILFCMSDLHDLLSYWSSMSNTIAGTLWPIQYIWITKNQPHAITSCLQVGGGGGIWYLIIDSIWDLISDFFKPDIWFICEHVISDILLLGGGGGSDIWCSQQMAEDFEFETQSFVENDTNWKQTLFTLWFWRNKWRETEYLCVFQHPKTQHCSPIFNCEQSERRSVSEGGFPCIRHTHGNTRERMALLSWIMICIIQCIFNTFMSFYK